MRRAYEEARAEEKARLDAEEAVRRKEERERQELAIQDWSWQEAMEIAYGRGVNAKEKEAHQLERRRLGAVKVAAEARRGEVVSALADVAHGRLQRDWHAVLA